MAGFKLDRSEENIPETGPEKVFDGRSIRENRNAYPAMFVQAAYEVAAKHRGDDFVVMPRAAYTGSSRYGVFWGGDIGGTQEGLRASIIAVQRAAVMGYPNWGSDTCGYNQQLMEQEVCGRWLAFSAFTPIMEVGPTRNVAFWNAPRPPQYDDTLIALWRLYARLHQRLSDYSYRLAQEAHRIGNADRPSAVHRGSETVRSMDELVDLHVRTGSGRVAESGKRASASSRSTCRRGRAGAMPGIPT